jgi:3-oxoacyl-[acyl-carrier-protein] synthase III
MNIGIKAVSLYRPKNRINNFDQKDRWGLSDDFINNKIGNLSLAKKSPNDKTTDIAKLAVEDLFNKNKLLNKKVQCLILVTQNPDDSGLPHSSAILHKKLKLSENCAVFDISLGCSGYVHGLGIAKGFMESQGFNNGILVTADPYSEIIDSDDRDTAMLFGDGASATWLSSNPVWEIGLCDFGTKSDMNKALSVIDGRLNMKGREVFNFAATYIPKSIESILLKSNLTMSDIDLVLLHQGSRFIVETLSRRIGSVGKTPFLSAKYGNTVSSSIPMMLVDCELKNVNRILLSGFGVGLAWATCILTRNKT